MFQDWINLHKKIRDAATKSDFDCPECGSRTIDYQYVGDLEKRIGYLDIWCFTCNCGIHMSRVLIPDNETMISFDEKSEVIAARIPDFKQIVPE